MTGSPHRLAAGPTGTQRTPGVVRARLKFNFRERLSVITGQDADCGGDAGPELLHDAYRD